MLNFYRRFLPNALEHPIPFFAMILHWSEVTKRHFEACKSMLAHPLPNAELSLWVDTSYSAAGSVLNQIVEGSLQPLGFFHAIFHQTETRYSTYDRELTALFFAFSHFR